MKIFYPNLSILNIRCEGKDNTKEQCDCISIVLPSKRNGWVNLHKNNAKDIIRNSNAC